VGDDFVYDTTDLNESASRIEVFAFGERVGMKAKDITTLRTSSDFALPWDRETLEWWLLLAGLGLVSYGFARGAFVLVARRPVTAGTAIVVAVTIAIPPVSWSGGGGGAVFYWELADPLGTGMVLVDEDGARVRHKTFKPFGAEHEAVGSLQSERTWYAGHRRHDDSGLYYMQARWMDPNAGVFVSIDPLVPDAFDPQSVNAFAYARSSPISNGDPDGMSPIRNYGEHGVVPPQPVPGLKPAGTSSPGTVFFDHMRMIANAFGKVPRHVRKFWKSEVDRLRSELEDDESDDAVYAVKYVAIVDRPGQPPHIIEGAVIPVRVPEGGSFPEPPEVWGDSTTYYEVYEIEPIRLPRTRPFPIREPLSHPIERRDPPAREPDSQDPDSAPSSLAPQPWRNPDSGFSGTPDGPWNLGPTFNGTVESGGASCVCPPL